MVAAARSSIPATHPRPSPVRATRSPVKAPGIPATPSMIHIRVEADALTPPAVTTRSRAKIQTAELPALRAYLETRDRRWRDLVTAHVEGGHVDDHQRVLAPFDALAEWLASGSRGCCFVNAFAELPDPEHPARRVISENKRRLRELFRILLLLEAGVQNPDLLARQLLTLHEGAIIVFSITADETAAQDARAAGAVLLAQ